MLLDAKFYQLSRGDNHLTLIKCYQRDNHQKLEVVLSFIRIQIFASYEIEPIQHEGHIKFNAQSCFAGVQCI